MSDQGYYSYPTIHGETVVFASEEDLWMVPAGGGQARRVTSGRAPAFSPALSPDGSRIAFTSAEEGYEEVFVMDTDGGMPRRLTFLGTQAGVVGWRSAEEILFISNTAQPFRHLTEAYAISPDGGPPQKLPVGPCRFLSYGPNGGVVIGRHSNDASHWKRYRGGTAGDLWIDANGDGGFRRLIELEGNPCRPLWLGERIYFVSDHEGVGNLYSCRPSGEDLRRHTQHDDYYVRFPQADGRRIVYHAGADLYVFTPETDESRKIEFRYGSPRTQRARKFVPAAKYLEDYTADEKGERLLFTTRGKAFSLGVFEGAARRCGGPEDARLRLPRWLADGKRFVAVSDAGGEERLEIHHADTLDPPRILEDLDLGRPTSLHLSPTEDKLALTNHRSELLLIDLESGDRQLIEKSEYAPILGFDWSPDGRWLAYGFARTRRDSVIRVYSLEQKQARDVTVPVRSDYAPAFDPEGKYLYFLSVRRFDPVYDSVHFELSFPKSLLPCLVTLRRDEPSPIFTPPEPQKITDEDEKEEEAEKDAANKSGDDEKKDEDGDGKPKKPEPIQIEIDFDGIAERIQALPVPEARYRQIAPLPKGKVLLSHVPVEGTLAHSWRDTGEPPAKTVLQVFDLETRETETLISGLSSFILSGDRKKLIYRAGNRLRVVKAGEKDDEKKAKKPPGRTSGWIDLGRAKVSIDPAQEWRQMYREAWRLQRDHFWTEDLSGVDWEQVYERYLPLLDRVATRSEFTDLLWEMQGELGSSHAYVFGGDVRYGPGYGMGFLGADLIWDQDHRAWRIVRIVQGDPWDPENSSPLSRPGVNLRAGDLIVGIDDEPVSRLRSPQELLVHRANAEIALTVRAPDDDQPRTLTVKTLESEWGLRYRDWVEHNRRLVHEKTDGRCGYLHIPDMSPRGYAEFHRYFPVEIDRDALIVDVRFNGGGHVSQLLLEKLARRRIGYVQSRHFGVRTYPSESPAGPMVAVTNEYAGSDGDIFSHCFKLMKLGTLIGKRTWGGVIGISPRHPLADKGLTTQPEFSFWFTDVGWQVENYGTDPNIEVEMRPQDYRAGADPQLARALEEIQKLLADQPAGLPEPPARPSLALPRLPKK